MPLAHRLILLHKQSTSSRVRFLRLPGGVLAFSPLPEGSSLHQDDYAAAVLVHPAIHIRAAESRLGLPEGSLAAEGDFHAWVQTPAGDVPVLLGYFTTIDPPFAAAETVGGQFIAMTDARSLPEIERQLLRRVYEYVIG